MAKQPARKKANDYRGMGMQQARILKQVLAFALENTVANAADEGDPYRPGIVDSILGIPGAIYSLTPKGAAQVQRSKGQGPYDDSTAVGKQLNRNYRGMQNASIRAQNMVGTDEPRNTAELAARVVPGFIGGKPSPGAITRAATRIAPKATPKVARALAKAKAVGAKAPAVVRLPAKAVGKTAKVAAEIALPLQQTKLKVAAPLAAGLTTGLDYINAGRTDEDSGVEYQSLLFDNTGEEPPAEMDELDQMMYDAAVEAGDIDPEAELQETLDADVTEDEVIQAEDDYTLNDYLRVGAGGAAILGAGYLGHKAFNLLDGRMKAAVDPAMADAAEEAAVAPRPRRFVGKRGERSMIGTARSIEGKLVDQNIPAVDMAERYLGREYAKNWGYRADRMTNASLQSRIKHHQRTGEAPGVSTKYSKLAPMAEAFAKELDMDEQRAVLDALTAASGLDMLARTGKQTSLGTDITGAVANPADLRATVAQVTQNPKLAKYYNAIQKSYDENLQYDTARGLTGFQQYQQLRRDMPNYVPHQQDLDPDVKPRIATQAFEASKDIQKGGQARTTEELAGITGERGIGNPFVALMDTWAQSIRRAELNDLRGELLRKLDQSGGLNKEGKKVVERMQDPTLSGPDYHHVKENGMSVVYKVRDPSLRESLQFRPRQSLHVLEAIRTAQQNMITGPLGTLGNLFALTAAPVMDSMAASMAAAKGTKPGILNRAMIGGHVGAARYVWDETKGTIGRTLRDHVIRENSWIKDAFGAQNVDDLATYFESAYENSIKAEMDARGITSTTGYGSPDPSELMHGAEDSMPNFAKSVRDLYDDDLAREAQAGRVGPVRQVFEKSKSAYVKAKSNAFARAYMTVIEGMQNGARYSSYAANRGKANAGRIEDVDKLISDTRRLTGDPSQHGSDVLFNGAIGANLYSGISTQFLYQLGKRMKENPGNTLFNLTATSGTLMAMLYTGLAYDEETLERHMKKTPAQKAVSISLPGGIELKLEPAQRIIQGILGPLYDHMSGITSGKFNPNFIEVMSNLLEEGAPDMTEEAVKDLELRAKKGAEDNVPFSILNPFNPNLSSFPLGNISSALQGLDPSMSRITGEPALVKEQEITGLEEGVDRPGSLLNGQTENMLTSLTATIGRTLMTMGDDAYRNYNAKRPQGEEASIPEASDLAWQSWKEGAAKGSGIAAPLFGHELPESVADVNFELMKERTKGVERGINVYNRDLRSMGITSTTNKNAEPIPQEPGVEQVEVDGTQAAYIGEMANQLQNRWLKQFQAVIGRKGDITKAAASERRSDLQDRTKRINAANEEKRYQYMLMLDKTRRYEQTISKRLGIDFTFDEFDPKDFLEPMPPPPE